MNSSQYIHGIDSVNWCEYETAYETAYGKAIEVPKQLKDLLSKDKKIAMDASHNLWSGLCHQHAYISSAAEPAYPYLKAALEAADEELRVELLDIFAGFVKCTSPKPFKGKCEFHSRIRAILKSDENFFEKIYRTGGPEVYGYTEFILEELRNDV